MNSNPENKSRSFLTPVICKDLNGYDPGSVSWDQFLYEQNFLPQHTEMALLYVRIFLGYLPPRYIVRQQELFIRAVMEDSVRRNLGIDQLYEEIEPHCKKIRNADLEEGGWDKCLKPNEYNIKCYNEHLVHLKQKARDRLSYLLGYEPDLAASLPAELFLRDFLSTDISTKEDIVRWYDCKAVTIAHYRAICIGHGKKEADDMTLIGLLYNQDFLNAEG